MNAEVRGVFHQCVTKLTCGTSLDLHTLDEVVVAGCVVEKFLESLAELRRGEVAVHASISLLASVDNGGERLLVGGECDGHMRGG